MRLVWTQKAANRPEASKEEYRIKRLKRKLIKRNFLISSKFIKLPIMKAMIFDKYILIDMYVSEKKTHRSKKNPTETIKR